MRTGKTEFRVLCQNRTIPEFFGQVFPEGFAGSVSVTAVQPGAGAQGNAARVGLGKKNIPGFRLLRGAYGHGHSFAQSVGLVVRNGGEGIAEHVHVIHADGHKAGHVHGQSGGGVVTAAEACF